VYAHKEFEGDRWALGVQYLNWLGDVPSRQTDDPDLLADDQFHDYSPAWSPTADRVAFLRTRVSEASDFDVNDPGELWLYDRSQAEPMKLVEGAVRVPRWSSDGTLLVYSRRISGGAVVEALDLSDERVPEAEPFFVAGEQLVNAAAVDLHISGALSFTADSSIHFTSDAEARPANLVRHPRELPDAFQDTQPSMNGDGDSVAFISTFSDSGDGPASQQLFRAKLRDGQFDSRMPLTDRERCRGSVQAPAW
jgi:Tol biopolymer transport system component